MVNERYRIAMAETLHYLKGITQTDISKIPNKFMDFLKENASQDYKCSFDYTKPLKDLKLKEETRGLIAMICLNYWCETEEKANFIKQLNTNEIKYQEELRKEYNVDNIFKREEKEKNIQDNNLLVEMKKENIIIRIFKRIMNFFHK